MRVSKRQLNGRDTNAWMLTKPVMKYVQFNVVRYLFILLHPIKVFQKQEAYQNLYGLCFLYLIKCFYNIAISSKVIPFKVRSKDLRVVV